MATLPSATVSVSETASAPGGGTRLLSVIAPVPRNADAKPRIFAQAAAVYALHGYSPGVDYVASHIEKTKLPVIFTPVPIATPGTVGRLNASGNTGTSVVSVAVGADGSLEETDGILTVLQGGTVGTDQIILGLSLDGGRSAAKTIRLGTASSYAIPYVGLVLSFADGTLVTGDTVLTWHSSAPMWDAAGLTAARTGMAAEQKFMRSWLVVGDLPDSTFAGYVTTEANAYATSHDRFIFARCNVRDRLPLATMSKVRNRMTGNPAVTFAEVGATGDTVARAAGSFVADGFVNGDWVTITGSISNNVSGKVPTVASGLLTFDTTDLAAEGPVSGVTITAEPCLTFVDGGVGSDSLVRNRGSWLEDGFRVGDVFTVTGTASNNVSAEVVNVTATTITVATGTFAAEVIGSFGVTITAGETESEYVANMDAAFAAVDNQKRIDPGIGRAYLQSPFLGYMMPRPTSWHLSIREYQHDIHVPTWKKELGPLDGASLEDANGNRVHLDERVVGGMLAARFSCLRTWGNGPRGAFAAMSLTRAPDSSLLSRTHNLAVVNLAMATVQSETENAVGVTLELKADGTATASSIERIEKRVNKGIKVALLTAGSEGKRCSFAEWKAATDDVLNVPGATLHGVLSLILNGTLEHIETVVRIVTAG